MVALFTGKAALVTGASSGIGRATALALAKEGANVVVADVSVRGGEETVDLIKAMGGDAFFVQTDVSQSAAVKTLVEKAVYTYGAIDLAINNAGIQGNVAATAACTEENWDRVISINLKGVWLCMKYEILQMRKQGNGTIVNVSSVAGLSSLLRHPAYSASKHGVIGLTKTAAVEYAKSGIRINAVCPGFIQTPMVDSGLQNSAGRMDNWLDVLVPAARLGSPEEVADSIVWLCSDKASYMTGHSLVIDGGYLVQ